MYTEEEEGHGGGRDSDGERVGCPSTTLLCPPAACRVGMVEVLESGVWVESCWASATRVVDCGTGSVTPGTHAMANDGEELKMRERAMRRVRR